MTGDQLPTPNFQLPMKSAGATLMIANDPGPTNPSVGLGSLTPSGVCPALSRSRNDAEVGGRRRRLRNRAERHRPRLVVLPRLPAEEAAVVVSGIRRDEGRRACLASPGLAPCPRRAIRGQRIAVDRRRIGDAVLLVVAGAGRAARAAAEQKRDDACVAVGGEMRARRARRAATRGDCPDSVRWCCSRLASWYCRAESATSRSACPSRQRSRPGSGHCAGSLRRPTTSWPPSP